MSEIFELSRFERAETEQPTVVLPFTHGELKETVSTFAPFPRNRHAPANPLPLIRKLCEALNSQHVSYCHWKSNWKLNRWLMGDGDLDLLVQRADKQRFIAITSGLGFKHAEPPADRQAPGILNFYGFDAEANKLVHLHVHYKLVIGNDLSKNYHLPAENVVLENSYLQGLMPVPTLEVELILFVLRMVLKHSVESIIKRKNSALEQELEFLESSVDRARLANLLSEVAPQVDPAFFDQCLQSLRQPNTFFQRMRIRQQLEKRLASAARRGQIADGVLKIQRRAVRLFTERLLGHKPRKRFVTGGILVAVVGGDGSGKTTALQGLNNWLGKKFATQRFHLGKPRRSPFSLALIVLLRVYRLLTNAPIHPALETARTDPRFPGYLQLLRWVSAGRDRRSLYMKARRFAVNGGVALCDRYPVPQLQLMDGPNIARTVPATRRNRFIKYLMRLENSYYSQVMPPDLLLVLRIHPDIAVQRKTTEIEKHVRTRSTELWKQDWAGTNAYVIDAGQPADTVMAEAQSIIWSKL